MTREAATADVGSQGLYWLPYLMGERTPHLDATARAAWVGLTAKHKRADLIRSVIEGVCYSQKDGLDIIEDMGVQLHSVRLSGGGATQSVLASSDGDVLNKKIATLESQEGSAYGAALLAVVGTGAYGSVEECCGVAIREVDHVLPDAAECQSLCEAARNLPGDLSGAEADLRPSVVFADVALPVPLDQPFTYLLPETLRHRVKIGCRLIVPFGSRKLTGVIVHLHDDAARRPASRRRYVCSMKSRCSKSISSRSAAGSQATTARRSVKCLRVMTPLSGEMRSSKMYSLTDAGRDAARQLLFGAETEDPTIQVLRLLERRSLIRPVPREESRGCAEGAPVSAEEGLH